MAAENRRRRRNSDELNDPYPESPAVSSREDVTSITSSRRGLVDTEHTSTSYPTSHPPQQSEERDSKPKPVRLPTEPKPTASGSKDAKGKGKQAEPPAARRSLTNRAKDAKTKITSPFKEKIPVKCTLPFNNETEGNVCRIISRRFTYAELISKDGQKIVNKLLEPFRADPSLQVEFEITQIWDKHSIQIHNAAWLCFDVLRRAGVIVDPNLIVIIDYEFGCRDSKAEASMIRTALLGRARENDVKFADESGD